MDLFSNLALGFERRGDADEFVLRVHWRPGRNAHRGFAWHWPGRHDRHAAPDDVCVAARDGAHHARRHLLRGVLRRLDDGHSGQSSRRDVVGRHRPRRLSDGPAGAGRRGPVRVRSGFVLCGVRGHGGDCRVCPAAGRSGAQVRRRRVFLADGARPGLRRGACPRFGAQGRLDDHPRAAPRDRRHRRRIPAWPASPSKCRNSPTASASSR